MKNPDLANVLSNLYIDYPVDFEARLRQIYVSDENKEFCDAIINNLKVLKEQKNGGQVKVFSVVVIFIATIKKIVDYYDSYITPPCSLYVKIPYSQLLEATDVTPRYLKALITNETYAVMAVDLFTGETEEMRHLFAMNL